MSLCQRAAKTLKKTSSNEGISVWQLPKLLLTSKIMRYKLATTKEIRLVEDKLKPNKARR